MSALENLAAVRRELRSLLIERAELVDGVLLGALARQHVLVLGPPGTAKSMLAREVCRRLTGKRYFEWLLTKFTTPEELFGPVSLSALESGRYERITEGKLPEAHVVFLDEVFKASSAILNALLTVLNERRFHQGATAIDVPLEVMLAASNELPEEDELEALYDRFLLRFTVGYIEHDHHFLELLHLGREGAEPGAVLAPGELAELQAKVAQIAVPDPVLHDLVELRKKLTTEGVIASDRRYRQALSVLKASALLDGRDRVEAGDLRWMEHVLWSDPEERAAVSRVLSTIAGGLEEEAKKLLAQAQEVEAYARRRWPDELAASRAALEAHTKLEDLHRRLAALAETATRRGRDATWIRGVDEKVVALQRRLLVARS